MNDMRKNLMLWLIIAAVLLMVFQNFNTQSSNEEIDYSSFLDLVNQNQVRSVEVEGLTIKGEYQDGRRFETVQPQIVDEALIGDMLDRRAATLGGARHPGKRDRANRTMQEARYRQRNIFGNVRVCREQRDWTKMERIQKIIPFQ